MKKLLYFIFLLNHSSFAQGTWVQKANFPGVKREFPFSFSIGTKGYVGGGRDSSGNFLSDFWEFDPVGNLWTQKANYTGTAVENATGFSLLNKGYVVFGLSAYDSVISMYPLINDLWEYDPIADVWNQKDSFPGIGRQAATSFSNGSRAFVGFGIDWTSSTQYNDIWEYDPLTNTWSQKASMPGVPRSGAVGFTISNKGYVGAGNSSQINYLDDFWEYDIASDTWSQKANIGIPRTQSAAFSIGNAGYLGTGQFSWSWLNDFNQYNPNTDTWTATVFPGVSRDQTAFFSIGNKGYIGLGSFFNNYYHNLIDFWEYTPDSTTSIKTLSLSNLQLNIFPNPAKNIFSIQSSIKNSQLEIFNSLGEKIYSAILNEPEKEIELKTAAAGIYFVKMSDGEKVFTQKLVIE